MRTMATSVQQQVSQLLEQGRKRVSATREVGLAYEGARHLTHDEIADLLSVIVPPPCPDPTYRLLIWSSQIDKVRKDLEAIKLIPAGIPRMKAYLRLESMQAYMEPGTNIGGIVADNVSAKSMQNTLNTRHNPGARQKGSSGIKGNQKLLNLYRRPPVTVLAFKSGEPQTFYSIMQGIRPLYVALTMSKLIVPNSMRTRVFAAIPDVEGSVNEIANLALDEKPKWYQYFNPPDSNICLEALIRRDVLYMHRLTVPDMVKTIEQAHPSCRVLYAPLTAQGDVIVHIYASGGHRRVDDEDETAEVTARMTSITGEEEEYESEDNSAVPDDGVGTTLERISHTGALARLYRVLPQTLIKGRAHIKDIVPFHVPVIDVVESEDGNLIRLSPARSKLYGIGPQHVVRLLAACGIPSEPLDALTVRVNLPRQAAVVDAPESLTGYLGSLPIALTRDEVDERTLLADQVVVNESDPTTFTVKNPALSIQVTIALKRVGLAVTGGPTYHVTYPDRTILGRVRDYQARARDAMTQYEQARRSERYAGDRSVSLLRPPTELDMASVVHYAEANGGTMREFIDVDLTDGVPVDVRYSFSNDFREMLTLLGIEGIYSFLTIEIHEQYADSGAALETASIMLIARYMTYRGFLMPFSRDGLVSQDSGPLSKAVVQTGTEFFARAAIQMRSDKLETQLSRVATGRAVAGGTSMMRAKSIATAPAPPREDLEDVLDELGSGAVPSGRYYIRDIDQIGEQPELTRSTL